MTRDSFRRDINREFDAISGSPSPALSARVRSALAEGRPARPGPVWMAGVAAAVIALIIVSVLVASNINRHQTGIVPGTIPSPSPATSPVVSATPSGSPSPVASPTSPAGAYICNSSAVGDTNAPLSAFVNAVRTGTHTGYDQVTIQFSTGHPGRAGRHSHHHHGRRRAHPVHRADRLQDQLFGAQGASAGAGLRGDGAVGARALAQWVLRLHLPHQPHQAGDLHPAVGFPDSPPGRALCAADLPTLWGGEYVHWCGHTGCCKESAMSSLAFDPEETTQWEKTRP